MFNDNELKENEIEEEIVGIRFYMNALLQPRKLISYVSQYDTKKDFYILLLLYAIFTGLNNLSRNQYNFTSGTLILAVIGGYIGGFISIYIYGGLMKLFGKLFGGEASQEDLRACILWSSIPNYIILPFTCFLVVICANNYSDFRNVLLANISGIIFYYLLILIQVVAAIWGYINLLRMVSEVQKYTKFKAFWTTFLPIVMLGIIYTLFILFLNII